MRSVRHLKGGVRHLCLRMRGIGELEKISAVQQMQDRHVQILQQERRLCFEEGEDGLSLDDHFADTLICLGDFRDGGEGMAHFGAGMV